MIVSLYIPKIALKETKINQFLMIRNRIDCCIGIYIPEGDGESSNRTPLEKMC